MANYSKEIKTGTGYSITASLDMEKFILKDITKDYYKGFCLNEARMQAHYLFKGINRI